MIQLKKARYVLPAVPFLAILGAEVFYNRSWRGKFTLWASRFVILLIGLFLFITLMTPIKLYSKKDGEFLPFRSIIENSTTRQDHILVAGMSPYTVQQVFSWYFDRPQEIVKNIKQFKVEWETGKYKFGILKRPSGASEQDIVGELKPCSRNGSYFLFINEKMQNSSTFAVWQTNSFEAIKKDKPEEREELMSIQLTSAAFEDGGMIPKKFTCDWEDASPPLKWSGIPKGTQSISLICDDPDAPAGTWVHWVLYNVPGDAMELPENMPSDIVLGNGAKQGMNDFRRLGYGGPCPPGGTHRYFFKIYALDIDIGLEPGATKAELLKAMKGHILGEGQLIGKYTR
jgi:Raf kinase inhibitor-like YbhB/YbcL family protein